MPIKGGGKELVAVTEEVWTEQLQALKNMTKDNLQQSMKYMEKIFLARLKIPFTYVFYMLIVTTLALFLWIQDM